MSSKKRVKCKVTEKNREHQIFRQKNASAPQTATRCDVVAGLRYNTFRITLSLRTTTFLSCQSGSFQGACNCGRLSQGNQFFLFFASIIIYRVLETKNKNLVQTKKSFKILLIH